MDSIYVKVLDLLRGRKLCGQPRHEYTQVHRIHDQYDLVQEIRYQIFCCMHAAVCDALAEEDDVFVDGGLGEGET